MTEIIQICQNIQIGNFSDKPNLELRQNNQILDVMTKLDFWNWKFLRMALKVNSEHIIGKYRVFDSWGGGLKWLFGHEKGYKAPKYPYCVMQL